jgi:hypothetical protein
MKKPWRKLWTSVRNDEKLRSMITRYGHEVSWVWTCLITSASDEGAVDLDLDDLAYLCILDENRLEQLLDVFQKKGLILREDGAIVIENWAEYQNAESDSAERVRKYRERQKTTDQKEPTEPRYSNVTVTPILELDTDIDTENTIPRADPPMVKQKYPKLDWAQLLDLWLSIGGPDPGGLYRLQAVHGRELLGYFDGLASEDIIQAVKNYGQVRSMANTWWNSNPSIVSWAHKNLTRFLPANFNPDEYKPRADPSEKTITDDIEQRRKDREKIPPAPTLCPDCGGPVRRSASVAGCKCGALWEISSGAWHRVEKQEATA